MSDMPYTLYQGDCLEVMPTLTGITAVVTDPPYGLEYKGNDWDATIPDWLGDARKVAPIVVFTSAPLTLWDYPRPDWVLCWYREASNARSLVGGFCHWSPVLVYGKPRFKVDSIKLHAIQHATPKTIDHPSPKPLALMEWLVTNCCPPGGTVLDPFMGSGTTGVACLNTGRRFVGIERDAGYFAIAEKRIQAAYEQARQTALPLEVA